MVHSINKDEFAASLFEKSLMKLYGGAYDIVENNASIEMHHFIGWIPETVRFADVSNKENLWARMKQNFKEGNIILAIGTDIPDHEK